MVRGSSSGMLSTSCPCQTSTSTMRLMFQYPYAGSMIKRFSHHFSIIASCAKPSKKQADRKSSSSTLLKRRVAPHTHTL
jgi:hypothetical protein